MPKAWKRKRRPLGPALAIAEETGNLVDRAILKHRERQQKRADRRRKRNMTEHDHALMAKAEAKRERRRARNLA